MCIPAYTGQGVCTSQHALGRGVCIPACTGQGGVCLGGGWRLPGGAVCPGGCTIKAIIFGVLSKSV